MERKKHIWFPIAIIFLFFINLPVCLISKPVYITTIHPVKEIVKEITGAKADVLRLLPPGVSPHTFSPTPSMVQKAQSATALIFASEAADGWATKLSDGNTIELITLLPEGMVRKFNGHSHEAEDNHDHNIDPHFWTDPLTVKALVPILADTLAKLDPDNAAYYKINADLFSKRLDILNRQVESILTPVKGKPVFLFHPSFLYMLKRYGLRYVSSLESSPGKEPTPKYIVNLSKKINSTGAKAIFTEPQLPDRPARVIAESAKVQVFVLDPLGGTDGRQTYSEIILYNARILRRALE